MEHDAEALGANADERNVELVAGRNVIYAAQYPAWNDGEAGCRGGLRQKFAPRKRGPKKAARPKAILHCSSLTTAINPDTLNEFEVCDAGNLIRFKKGLFSSCRGQRRVGREVGSAKERDDQREISRFARNDDAGLAPQFTRVRPRRQRFKQKTGAARRTLTGNNKAGKNYKRQIRSSRS
jgi:hypothetical protein